jgi:hypothetical protein
MTDLNRMSPKHHQFFGQREAFQHPLEHPQLQMNDLAASSEVSCKARADSTPQAAGNSTRKRLNLGIQAKTFAVQKQRSIKIVQNSGVIGTNPLNAAQPMLCECIALSTGQLRKAMPH